MSPTIIFVPGFWEGSAPFSKVNSLLQSQGFITDIAEWPSTGTTSPNNPTMHDDIAAVRSKVVEYVDKEQEVLLVLHSAGGFIGSNAIEDLDVGTRRRKGIKGGVSKIVFIAGGLLLEGAEHNPPPVFECDVGPIETIPPIGCN